MRLTFEARTVLLWAWASLVANAFIIVSGALVRLTGSGLGCPTWPKCTDESFVPHEELGIHGAIEFGNRLVTYLVAAAAIAALFTLWRSTLGNRRRLTLAWAVVTGVPLQAVVGGLSVLSGLNPWVVGLHMVLSMIMVVLASWLVIDLRGEYGTVDAVSARLAQAAFVVLAASIYLGTVVTGAGPHAGDAGAARNGLDPMIWTRFHSLMSWAFVVLIVLLWIRMREHPERKKVDVVILLSIAQGAIGYVQYFNQLPVPVVLLHLAGSALVLIASTWALAAASKTELAKTTV